MDDVFLIPFWFRLVRVRRVRLEKQEYQEMSAQLSIGVKNQHSVSVRLGAEYYPWKVE
jgi:hypothetical protein